MRLCVNLAAAVLAIASAPSIAQTFVSAERDALVAAMPPIPVDGSLAAALDIDGVRMMQAIRSPSLEAEAAADADRGGFDWAQMVIGDRLSAERTPLAFALFDAVRRDATQAGTDVKAKGPFRDRPQVRYPDVKPSLTVGGHGANSWPANRMASARIWAGVLSDLFPDEAPKLSAAAERSGWLRVVGGVHYPSDLVAGRAVADRFLERLRAHPDYQRQLEAARAELGQTR